MIIRQETASDHDKIYRLVKTAFATAQVSDGTEQDFINMLRASGNYIPELALVAEEDGKLIGHVMLTRQTVDMPGGQEFQALLPAPLAVALEYRNKGIGAKLAAESLSLAKEMGYQAVFLVGNPDYYGRLGFAETTKWGIKNSNEIPDKFVLGLELNGGALDGISGSINFHS